MTLRFKSLIVFLVLAVAVQFLPVSLRAADPLAMLQEGKPAFTLAEAKNYVKEIVPLVEKAAGRKFRKVVPVVLADRDMMTTVLAREVKMQLANLYPNMSDDQLVLMSKVQASALSVGLMGKYGQNGKLYLMPKNLLPILKVTKVDEKNAKPMIKLIITHELTHALQDQVTDLKRVNQIKDADQLSAFAATIEGQAVWTQEVVGRQLGLDDTVLEMSRMLSAGAIKYDDPALEMINKMMATQFEQTYLGGEKFIAYHYQQGGNERVWQIVANPPLKTSMIAQPATYSETPQTELDYAKLFDGLESELEGKGWESQNQAVGHMMLKSVYIQMDEAELNAILDQVQHVQCFIARNPSLEWSLSISAVTVKDEQFAAVYLKSLSDMAVKNMKTLAASPSIRINLFGTTNFKPYSTSPNQKVILIIESKEKQGRTIKQVFVRIFQGKLMLEFTLNNYDLSDRSIAKLADGIFARYQSLLKSKWD